MDHDVFDEMLKNRYVPEAPSNLAHRIICASKNVPQDQPFAGVQRWVNGFLDAFLLPKPAFAMAVFVLFGFGIGLWSDNISLLPSMTPDDLSDAFEVSDYIDAGDFL